MANVISKVPVTLTPAEAEAACNFLLARASDLWRQARKTKSASVRAYCETQARAASDLETEIIRRLYSQTSEPDFSYRSLDGGTINPNDSTEA